MKFYKDKKNETTNNFHINFDGHSGNYGFNDAVGFYSFHREVLVMSKSERESPWFKMGSDKSYQAYCRTQPSAYSGQLPCIYAHYRTAKNSGIGCKPVYSGIPLTYMEHLEQHRIGQYSFAPRSWWEEMVERFTW